MKPAPQDPLVTRRKEKLITIGFRTTRECRDQIDKVSAVLGLASPSSLIRLAVDEYLTKAAKR